VIGIFLFCSGLLINYFTDINEQKTTRTIKNNILISRDGKNSLFFREKVDFFLVSFHLNLVGIFVAFSLKKLSFSLLSSLTIVDFFNNDGHFS
jgi:hypothetical protein